MKKQIKLLMLLFLIAISNSYGQLDFDGNNDQINIDGIPEYFLGDGGNPFTVEAWFLIEGNNSVNRDRTIFSNLYWNGVGFEAEGITLSIDNQNRIFLQWFDFINDPGDDITGVNVVTGPIENNKWYHVALSYDGTAIKIYVDGVEVRNRNVGTINYSAGNNNRFIIGGEQLITTFHFNGAIDEVRIWDVALTLEQVREMMNQEIDNTGINVIGEINPQEISGPLQSSSLIGYYDMNLDDATDSSGNGNDGITENMEFPSQIQNAPLPYTTITDGDWDDPATWEHGNVWNLPNTPGFDPGVTMEWNIVQTDHNVQSHEANITILGLLTETTGTKFTIGNPTQPLDELNTGHSLRVTHYLKMHGDIDLVGESQLIQDENSIVDTGSTGVLQIDQQGASNLYNYNMWSSPVTPYTAVTGGDYTVSSVLKDGTNSAMPANINWLTTGYDGAATTPISLADYWVYKFSNLPGDYANWIHVRKDGPISIGEGYTMKGMQAPPLTNAEQNYTFEGLPNNGSYSLDIFAGNDYLIGNPFPSALNIQSFIRDNISGPGGTNSVNVINGAVYFWEHIGGNSHNLASYVGGYATANLMGSTVASSTDPMINDNGALGTKIPGDYIPVGQGFFVTATPYGEPIVPVGGSLVFRNSQRDFARESDGLSIFFDPLIVEGTNRSSSSSTDTRKKIKLGFHTSNNTNRQLLIGADNFATSGYDLGYDAPHFSDGSIDDMYWKLNDSKLTIQGVPNFNVNEKFPLEVEMTNDGDIRVTIDELINIPESKNIYLHDSTLGIFHDLRTSDYEISLMAGIYTDRFELVFSIYSEDSFVTTWNSLGSDGSTDIIIPARYSAATNYNVNWGDGTTSTGITGVATHDYGVSGIYTVVITGDFSGFSFKDIPTSVYNDKLLMIDQWSNTSWYIMNGAFYNCSNLQIGENAGTPNLENTYFLNQTFEGCSSLNQDVSQWNVQNVGFMDYTFANCSSFNQNLGGWDISNTISMKSILNGASLSKANYDATLIGWNTLSDNEIAIPLDISVSVTASYCSAEEARTNLLNTYNWRIRDHGLSPECTVKLLPRVYLQGACLDTDPGDTYLMRDDLRNNKQLPTTSPYNDGVTCDISVFYTGGSDGNGKKNEDIVDWVLVELRDKTDNTLVIDSQSALLQRNGSVVGVDDLEDITFALPNDEYFVVIKHRNHLSIITENPISLDNTVSLVDFTDTFNLITNGAFAQTYHPETKKLQAMWAGNTNADNLISYTGFASDPFQILFHVLNHPRNFLSLPTWESKGYLHEDVDMNGSAIYTGAGSDSTPILENILNHPENTANDFNFIFFNNVPEN